jgi:hypothetical protein
MAAVTELLDLLCDSCRTNGLQGPNSAGVVLEQAVAPALDPQISARAAADVIAAPIPATRGI